MPRSRIWRFVAPLLAAGALLLNGLAIAPGAVNAATTSYYFAIANGNWNAASGVWQTCTNAAGTVGCVTAGVTPPTATANVVTIKSGNTVHVSSAVSADQVVVAAGGHLVIDPGFTLAIGNGAGVDLTVGGTATLKGMLDVSGTLSYAAGSALDISGSVITAAAGAISGASTASVVTVKTGGSLTIVAGSSYAVTGTGAATLNVNAGGTATIDGALSGIPNMTVNGTLTASANMTLTGTVASQVAIAGSFTMTAGILTATRTTAGFAVQVKSGGTLALNGASSASISTVATARLEVLGGGILDLGPSAAVVGAGLVQVSSGAILRVGDANGISAGTSASSGNIRTSGIDTYNAAASYEYRGSTAQVTGAALPATIKSITIANTAGVSLTNPLTLTSGGSVVNGAFNLGASNVTASGTSTLAVRGAGSITRTTGYVIGNLQKVVPTGSPSLTFEVGVAVPAGSMPVTVAFAGITTSGTLKVKATSNDHPSIASSTIKKAISLNGYYSLTNAGVVFGTYGATFGFPGTFGSGAAQLDVGVSPSALVVGRFSASTWTYPSIGTRTATGTQVTGLTGFGDFALGQTGPTPPPPPSVTLTPLASATVFASETLAATATSSTGIARVEFLIDGSVVGTDTTAPYSLAWATTAVADGPHTVSARVVAGDAQTALSANVPVSVANALPSDARLDVDFASQRLSVDDYARYGVYAYGAPLVLPVRYRSATPSTGGTTEVYRFLGKWDLISAATRDEITAFLNQPLRGSLYVAVADAPAVGTPSGTAQTLSSLDNVCVHVHPGFEFLVGTAVLCVYQIDHFTIYYLLPGATGAFASDAVSNADDFLDDNTLNPSCTPATPCSNGIPDYIDKIAAGLGEAYRVYVTDLQYPAVTSGKVSVVTWNINGGITLPNLLVDGAPPVITIESVDRGEPYYLAHHELFHVFEYQYIAVPALLNNQVGGGPEWWMEATADWGAGYVARSAATCPGGYPCRLEDLEADAGFYVASLPIFLSRPNEKLNTFQNPFLEPCPCRQYGAAVFAEYLTEQYTPVVIRETWEKYRDLHQQEMEPALEAVAQDKFTSLSAILPGFTRANYLLSYDDSVGLGASDVDDVWRARLVGTQSLDGDSVGPARPKREDRIDLTAGQTVFHAQFLVAYGGAQYFDIVPTGLGTQTGELAVQVSAVPNGLDARIMVIRYPLTSPHLATICVETPITLDAQGNGSVSVPVENGCYAVLVFTGVDLDRSSSIEYGWTATLTLPTGQLSDLRANAPDLASQLTPNVPFTVTQDLGTFSDINVSPNFATTANGASASAATGAPAALIDGNPATFWEGSNEFTIDLGQVRTVDVLHWVQADFGVNGSDDTTVCVSTDGAAWTCLGQFSVLPTWAGYCICPFYLFGPTTARYWRFTDNNHLAVWRVYTMELGIQAPVDPTDPQIDPYTVYVDNPTMFGWHTGWAKLDFSSLAPGTTANVRLDSTLGGVAVYDHGMLLIAAGYAFVVAGSQPLVINLALDPGVYYLELTWFDADTNIFGGTATVNLTITSDKAGGP